MAAAHLFIGLLFGFLGLGAVVCHPRADTEPQFIGPSGNVTVTEGSDALLPCVVDNLGYYRVAWIRVESQTILSIHTHVITRNYRITLLHKTRQHWDLQISGVEESDRGQYMCQINTSPMKKKIIFLEVLVPPKFVDRGENVEVLAREGTNVTLSCRVRGYPTPIVTWEREDGRLLLDQKSGIMTGIATFSGEELTIVKVSRLHMGMYLCSATSSYMSQYRPPQTVTRGVMLQVLFPPMIWIPNQLAYASVGDTVTLDCYTEAFPMSINYWTKSDSCMVVPDERFSVTLSDNVYKVSMMLVITDLKKEDFGSYKCVARNSLGSTEGVIRLYETEHSRAKNEMSTRIEERNHATGEEFIYTETKSSEVGSSDIKYELTQNRNLEESLMPKTVQLERKHISDFFMKIRATSGEKSFHVFRSTSLTPSAILVLTLLVLPSS